MARLGFATILLLVTGMAPVHGASRVTKYLIVSGDSMNGSWDSRDEARLKSWRAKYNSHYAWFQQDGRDYIVSDAQTLAALDAAMAPQREVNRGQEEVNRHQEGVNRLQEGVNSHQADVNRDQAEVNRQHSNELQSRVNTKQHGVNAEQEQVNQKQAVVNREQGEVNRMQTHASAVIDKALQSIFDDARRQGLAHEVR